MPSPTCFPIIAYCAVGTGSTTPAATDTGLVTEVDRTSTSYQTDAIARPASGVYQLTRYIEFDYAEANGNLTEWGFSNNASRRLQPLQPRAVPRRRRLARRPSRRPATTSSRIIYTLEVALSPASLTAASFAVTGVGTVNGDYMLLGGPAPTTVTADRTMAPDLKLFSVLARGNPGTTSTSIERPGTGALTAWDTDQSGAAYTDDVEHTADNSDLQTARGDHANARRVHARQLPEARAVAGSLTPHTAT